LEISLRCSTVWWSMLSLDDLKQTLRASPVVQADETSWREDGINGSIWNASTPTLRYDEYHHAREGAVVKQWIGENFQGMLGSDFSGATTCIKGSTNAASVHFLRDLHDLKKLHPDDGPLGQWATQVKEMYERAKAAPARDPQ
jgi:transposase